MSIALKGGRYDGKTLNVGQFSPLPGDYLRVGEQFYLLNSKGTGLYDPHFNESNQHFITHPNEVS